ncbi:MAG: hypothetical protein ABIH21_01220 [Patescibacteria group bacterium]
MSFQVPDEFIQIVTRTQPKRDEVVLGRWWPMECPITEFDADFMSGFQAGVDVMAQELDGMTLFVPDEHHCLQDFDELDCAWDRWAQTRGVWTLLHLVCVRDLIRRGVHHTVVVRFGYATYVVDATTVAVMPPHLSDMPDNMILSGQVAAAIKVASEKPYEI